MKKKTFFLLFFLSMAFISLPAYAFDITGWWKSDKKTLKVIKITKERFMGLPYEVLTAKGDKMTISLDRDEETKIEIKGESTMVVHFPSGETFTFEKLTEDTSLSKAQAASLAK